MSFLLGHIVFQVSGESDVRGQGTAVSAELRLKQGSHREGPLCAIHREAELRRAWDLPERDRSEKKRGEAAREASEGRPFTQTPATAHHRRPFSLVFHIQSVSKF